MNKTRKSSERGTKKKRLLEAKKSFQKMQEEIAPFIKHREFKQYSTAGEWCETSNLFSIRKFLSKVVPKSS